jgi:hypothetical protein
MDERDFYGIIACVLGLTAIALLHARMLVRLAEDAEATSADVQFLMDHAQIRETEARP